MKTSSIGVETPSKADVGAVVLSEDASGVFFEDLQPSLRRLAEVLNVGGFPGVRWVRYGFEHRGVNIA